MKKQVTTSKIPGISRPLPMAHLFHPKLLLILVSSLLVSCSGVYRDPPKNPAATAELRNTGKSWSLYHWERYRVEMIDDLAVNYSLSWTEKTRVMRVTAGKHRLVVSMAFNKGFMTAGPYEALTDLVADFKAGRKYQLVGSVEGSAASFWIEDTETHEKISNVAVQLIGRTIVQPSYPVYMPIVISS